MTLKVCHQGRWILCKDTEVIIITYLNDLFSKIKRVELKIWDEVTGKHFPAQSEENI